MPYSYTDFKQEIKNYISGKYSKNIKILDVGPGCGTYASLLNEYKNIDAVEIYKPYIYQFNLNDLYKNVYNCDIMDFDFDYYDLIIIGDILEHLTVENAIKLIDKIYDKCNEIIVSVPYLADFNYLYDNEPNKNEIHLQVDLTENVMLDRYPKLQKFYSNDRIGVYFKNKCVYNNNNKDLAISVYVDNNENIIDEFYWLYKSFIYSDNYTKSDLIAFCNPDIVNKLPVDDNVKIIPLEPFNKKSNIWNNYPFINSIQYLVTNESKYLNNYKYILKTDCDVFLTRNLLNFRPILLNFGLGCYMKTINARDNIVRIINNLGLDYNFIHNVGSSMLADNQTVLNFSNLQYQICEYLMNNEFRDYVGSWPDWNRGVLTMYAGEIAANQYGYANVRTNVLDSYSMSNCKIPNDMYHIHAYHTTQFFSKHDFRLGKYKDLNPDDIDINLVNNYCYYIVSKTLDDIKRMSNYNF